jgi:subtilisin family serine protease
MGTFRLFEREGINSLNSSEKSETCMKLYRVIRELTITTAEGKELVLQSGAVFKSGDHLQFEGVEEVRSEPIDETNDSWWIANYGIRDIWKMGYTGKGVKVAVLDSGIYLEDGELHKDFLLDPMNLVSFTNSSDGMSDSSGHGIHVSGIIKASNNGYGITGLAYDCDFYFGKVVDRFSILSERFQ